MFQTFLPNGLHSVGDLICPECEKQARATQIKHLKQATINNLYSKPGQLIKSIHHRMMEQAAQLLAPTPQAPKPITAPASTIDIEIVRGNTNTISQLPTAPLAYDPITPIPETIPDPREKLFYDVPPVALLWPDEEDEDATEIRERKTAPRTPAATQEIPALNAERLLVELTRGPVHERGTGEHVPIKQPVKNWMC